MPQLLINGMPSWGRKTLVNSLRNHSFSSKMEDRPISSIIPSSTSLTLNFFPTLTVPFSTSNPHITSRAPVNLVCSFTQFHIPNENCRKQNMSPIFPAIIISYRIFENIYTAQSFDITAQGWRQFSVGSISRSRKQQSAYFGRQTAPVESMTTPSTLATQLVPESAFWAMVRRSVNWECMYQQLAIRQFILNYAEIGKMILKEASKDR